MDADTATGSDHSDALAWDNASSLSRDVIWSCYRISNDAGLAQDDALGNAYQVTGRNDHILGKSAVYLCSNIPLIVDTERLST